MFARLRRPGPAVSAAAETSYAAAYRLLSQLRPVARQLSVGLDPVTIAQGLLQSVRDVLSFDRGAVFVRTGGDRLVPLSSYGGAEPGWDLNVGSDGPFADAWVMQRPQRISRQLSGGAGSSVVIPLVIGLRTFGMVGLETATERAIDAESTTAAAQIVAEGALRLETALLFDEVRGMATTEERRRLAREIHDGIAQELVSIGYLIDGLVSQADASGDLRGQLQDLRAEITRIVQELRLSIFDLRSDVDVHGGLGAALSEYVRTVGRQSDLTVHLSLKEASARLPAETEAELLRIGQEAVTNVRKHADAGNLWVTLEVEPPAALLRVEDDGRGLGRGRDDSYGLEIMRERAARLRAELTVAPRQPRGTLVEVHIPATREPASVPADHADAGGS